MYANPNVIYYIALFLWPIIAYRLYKRYELDRAVILLVLVPYLFLPAPHPTMVMKLPLLPELDKESIPILALLFILYINKVKVTWFPQHRLAWIFCVLLFVSPFFTVFTNKEALYFSERVIPGLRFSEALSILVATLLKVYVPFILGYSLLSSSRSHEELVKYIFVLGLVYSVLMLYEVRMSPQLHRMLYGFFPHDFRQQIRAGGFRPVVFLGHGLLVALYGCMTTIAAFALWRNKHKIMRGKGLLLVLYMCLVLVLCKTYSAVIYFMLFAALTLFLYPKMRIRAMSAVAIIVLAFPAIRHQLPLADVTEFFMDLNPDRAQSLQFRFTNEDSLLEKANQKSLFGWGTWGRNRIFDPVTGKDLSVTDGAWIIRYGTFGWVGYLAVMGLLAYPLITLIKSLKKPESEEALSPYTLALCAILMIYLIDQIPNASLGHLTYLVAGAILGNAKQLKIVAEEATKKRNELRTKKVLKMDQDGSTVT